MKRFVSVILAFALICALGGTASAAGFAPRYTYSEDAFSDINEDMWYGTGGQAVIKTAFELGIMNGYDDGRFLPEGALRVCEAVKMAAVARSLYVGDGARFDVSKRPWYADYLSYALRCGLISADDFEDYNAPATRADVAYIFRNVLPEGALSQMNTVNSVYGASVGTPRAGSLLYFLRAGVLDGTVSRLPGDGMLRAEAAAFAVKLARPDERTRFEILPKNGDAAYRFDFSVLDASGRVLALGYQSAGALPLSPLRTEEEYFHYGTDSFYSTYENFGSVRYLSAGGAGVYVYGIYLRSDEYIMPNGIRCGSTREELSAVYGGALEHHYTSPPGVDFGYAYLKGDSSPWYSAVFNIEYGRVAEIVLLCSVE